MGFHYTVHSVFLFYQYIFVRNFVCMRLGLQWNLRPNDVEIEILVYTRELISKILPSEVDMDTGWIQNGGLFIATTKERMDEYLRLMTIGKAFGVESHALTPKVGNHWEGWE